MDGAFHCTLKVAAALFPKKRDEPPYGLGAECAVTLAISYITTTDTSWSTN
jgi:hypothetical protein